MGKIQKIIKRVDEAMTFTGGKNEPVSGNPR